MQNFGISAALVTPFNDRGEVDTQSLVYHAKAVFGLGADSITVFGTTGEGASIGQNERQKCLDALFSKGVDPNKVVVGLCATSVEDLLTQADAATSRGVMQLLMPPPFYFKDVEDNALFDWFSDAVSRLAKDVQVILYHIPQVTGIPLSIDLVQRLQTAFPVQIKGIKDSSGSWSNTVALLNETSLAVLVGDERQLAKASKLGCAGSICGLANVVPLRLRAMLDSGAEDAEINALVEKVVSHPVTPAIKSLVSILHDDKSWRRVRAPFTETPDTVVAEFYPAMSAVTQNELKGL
ncbi:MAG: dihydrodipicolinate synthase family protein [Hyphomicrobiales bacterium]